MIGLSQNPHFEGGLGVLKKEKRHAVDEKIYLIYKLRGGEVLHLVDEEGGGERPEVRGGGEHQLRKGGGGQVAKRIAKIHKDI